MKAFCAVFAAGVALCAAAHAQRVTVGEEVVVTATRFADSYLDKPVNVTVISAEDIARSTAKTVPDLLSEQTGIALHDFFGNNAAGATVDMRGFGVTGGQNTLILLDGRRISDIDLSGVQWGAIPLSAIERIEIVRGGGAVLYGDGASAGVINIITRSPVGLGNVASVGLRAGSYDTRDVQLNANYSGARAGINLTASNYDSDGYRSNNANRQFNAQSDLRWLLEQGEIAVKLGADRQGIRLPGARMVQPSAGIDLLDTDPRGAATPLDYATRDGNRVNVDWRQQFGFGEIDIGGGYRNKDQRSYYDQSGFPNYRVVNLDVASFTPRARLPLSLFGAEHTLVAGVDWYRWDYRLRISNSVPNITQPINTVAAVQENTAFYLYDTIRLGSRTTLSAGARREHLKIDATDAYDPNAPGAAFGSAAPPGTQSDTRPAWELGLRHQLDPRLALIGKLGHAFRFANIDEIYETSSLFTNQFQFLRPQTSDSAEITVEARAGRADLRASLFRIDVDDEIHLDPFTTGIGNTNLPPSRRQGLELEGRWRALDSLMLGANYSYTDARFREGVLPGSAFTQQNVVIAGKTVPLVPMHKLNLSASWAITEHTRLNALAAHVSSQYMDNDEGNTLGTTIPAYTLLDLKLQHASGPWRFSAAVNNLLDRQYYSYAVRSQFVADRYNAYPLPQRNAMFSAEYALR